MTSSPAIGVVDAPSLAERTSIRIGGRAIAEVSVEGRHGLDQLPETLKRLGGEARAFGRGSNILAADADLPLVLVRMAGREDISVLGEEGDTVLVRVPGGMRLSTLLARAAALKLSGLEGLAGIPGSVGGAVAMNAGSFGVEIGGLLRKASVFSPDRGLVEVDAQDMALTYRHSAVQDATGLCLVHDVTLELRPGNGEAVREKMAACMLKKRQSQPLDAASAGSAFKNPAPDAAAGKLLEEAGFKGKKLGGMAFSPLHANFLLNEGGGTCEAALELLNLAREAVHRTSGQALELEIKVWP